MNLDAQWIVGFVDGEGCFHIGISKNPSLQVGYQVLPEFVVTQHARSVQVLHGLKEYFQAGVVRFSKGKKSSMLCFRIRDQKALREKIIPFFEKHSLKTAKRFDFSKFRRVLLCMENKEHLTQEGFEKIQKIRGEMKELS
jgi:LAGLIDADG endonuclease